MRTYSLTVPLDDRALTMRTYMPNKYHDRQTATQDEKRVKHITNQKVMSLRFLKKNACSLANRGKNRGF